MNVSNSRTWRQGRLLLAAVVAVMVVGLLGAACTATPPASPGGDLLKEIQDRGELRVAFVDSPGIAWKDPATDQWTGLEHEMAVQFAEALEVELVPVETTWANVVAELQSGKADLLMPGLGATPQRAMVILFSRPYDLLGVKFVIRKDEVNRFKTLDDLNSEDITIALPAGSANIAIMDRYVPNAKILETGAEADARYQEVLAGRADAANADNFSVQAFVAEHGDWAASFPDEPFAGRYLTVGIPAGEFHLKAFVDASIDFLETQGTLDELREKYHRR